MQEDKDFRNPFNEYQLPADSETGKGKALVFDPDEHPNSEEFAAKFNAVAATKPTTIQDFFIRLATLDKQDD